MTSNNIFTLISIDSFFNGILFLLIFNIKLCKKDKIEYYNNFILSVSIRYLYFIILWASSVFLSFLFYTEIDISILSIPLFVYLFYRKLYFNKIIDWLEKQTHEKVEHMVSILFYNIIQFLCKTILTEETNIKQIEITHFYKRVGIRKLIEFAQSFALACLYDYISSQYSYLSYVFQYNNFRDTYDKKQHILGLLNSKDWDQLFHSSTINLFFDIYKNSNNRQISKFIQYQIVRFQYKLLIFFSVWSIVDYLANPWLVPFLFYYIYIEQWKDNCRLYILLSLISIMNQHFFLSIVLFIIPTRYYYHVSNFLNRLKWDIISIGTSAYSLLIVAIPIEYQLIFIALGLFFYRSASMRMGYFAFLGYFSNYDYFHMGGLLFILIGFHAFVDNLKIK
jgi:hypothetical protein